jgi:hypothetical protein
MRPSPSPWYTGRDMATSLEQAKTFYRGALTALSFLEERHPTGRRFGQNADLRWASLRGHLMDIDRLDRSRPKDCFISYPDEAYAAFLDTELRAHALTPTT